MDIVPLVGLEREWRDLASGRLRVAFRGWTESEPALARFAGPQRLVAFLWDERVSPSEKDLLLAAVLRVARTEPLAGRLVVQAMLPGLKGLASRLLRRSPERGGPVLEREELWQVLFCSLLERIASYPLERRPRKIAANLLLDTLHATVAVQKRESGARGLVPLAELREDELVSPEMGLGPRQESNLRTRFRKRSDAGAGISHEQDLSQRRQDRATIGATLTACGRPRFVCSARGLVALELHFAPTRRREVDPFTARESPTGPIARLTEAMCMSGDRSNVA